MKVEQVYTLVNNVTSEILGKSDVVAEDLSNVVDVGKEILNGTDIIVSVFPDLPSVSAISLKSFGSKRRNV